MMIKKLERKKYLYTFKKKGGKEYNTNIILIGSIIRRMNRKFAPMILVCGGQRSGKSFFALWLALKILKWYHPEKEFDIKKYVYYDPAESLRALSFLEKEPLIIDEAGSIFHKMEFYNRQTRAMDKIIQTQAYKCNVYIFVSPFMSDISKPFKKHFDFIVLIPKRGLGVVYTVPKKYHVMTDKEIKPYFTETISVTKKHIPKKYWDMYEQFSFEQKEKIRIDVYEKMMEDNNGKKGDPFGV